MLTVLPGAKYLKKSGVRDEGGKGGEDRDMERGKKWAAGQQNRARPEEEVVKRNYRKNGYDFFFSSVVQFLILEFYIRF